MRFDIGKIQFEAVQQITLWFHVMSDQVIKTCILTARFNIASTFEVKKMLAKWRAIRLFPTYLYGVDNGDQR